MHVSLTELEGHILQGKSALGEKYRTYLSYSRLVSLYQLPNL